MKSVVQPKVPTIAPVASDQKMEKKGGDAHG